MLCIPYSCIWYLIERGLEAFLGRCQISTIEPFSEIVCGVKVLTIFAKKFHHRRLAACQIHLWSDTYMRPSIQEWTKQNCVGNKAKGRISKRVFQESKGRQIFRKTNLSYPLIRARTYCARSKCERSISPSTFLWATAWSHVTPVYLVFEFIFLFLVLLKEMWTLGESRVLSFLFLVLVKEVRRRVSPRFPCITPGVEGFSSDL